MADENQKQAVSIVTTLSGQLMAAALAMIALEGAFLTFALDKKVCGGCFWLFVSTSFLLFVFSIILGGKGIAILYKAGATGNWDYAQGDGRFQWQTGLCCLGLIMFILAVFSAQKDKPSDADAIKAAIVRVADNTDRQAVALQQLIAGWQSNQAGTLAVQFSKLERQLEQLHAKIEQMRETSPPILTNLIQIAGITNVVQLSTATNVIEVRAITNVIVLPPTATPSSAKPATTRRWGVGIGIGSEQQN